MLVVASLKENYLKANKQTRRDLAQNECALPLVYFKSMRTAARVSWIC